jgi:hypothetical protein
MTIAEAPLEPLHRRLGVTDDELDAIRDRLGGRDPAKASPLSIISALFRIGDVRVRTTLGIRG